MAIARCCGFLLKAPRAISHAGSSPGFHLPLDATRGTGAVGWRDTGGDAWLEEEEG